MRLLKNLLRFSRRKWTVEEVHALIGSGHLDQAAIAARDLNELTPDIDRMRRCLNAEIAFHRGDDEAAEDGYRAVLTEAPGFAEAHYGLSMLLLERDDVERALSHAQFAKIAQPDSSRFLAQAGLCFLRQGSLAVAEKMLKQVVRERSGDKVSWNNLGIVLLSKGEPGEAQVAFKRALAIDPSFEKAVCNLRMLESDLRDAGMRIIDRTGPSTSAPLASTRANVSVTVASGDVPELDGAREMARNGSVDEALRAAEDALSHSPDNSALACAVARFYCEQGEPQGGVELLNAFLVGRPPDATVLATLGACHMANHDERAAIEALSQAMAAGDESPVCGSIWEPAFTRWSDTKRRFRTSAKPPKTCQAMKTASASRPSSCRTANTTKPCRSMKTWRHGLIYDEMRTWPTTPMHLSIRGDLRRLGRTWARC